MTGRRRRWGRGRVRTAEQSKAKQIWIRSGEIGGGRVRDLMKGGRAEQWRETMAGMERERGEIRK
jgi:hypothetical protein